MTRRISAVSEENKGVKENKGVRSHRYHTSVIDSWSGGGLMEWCSLSYAYDAANRLTSVTDTTFLGTDFQFTYDTRGQLPNKRQGRAIVPNRLPPVF